MLTRVTPRQKTRLILDKPLGNWFPRQRHSRDEWHRTREWLYKIESDDSRNDTVTRYRQSANLADWFVADETTEDVPAHAHPVQITSSHYGVKPLQDYKCMAQRIPARTVMDVDTVDLPRLNSSKKIIAVSDGSMHPMTGMAACAWVLTNEDEDASIREAEDIWTNPLHMTSYRAELAGIHNMLTHASQHCNTRTPLEVWCDNTSVLKMTDPSRGNTVVELSGAEGKLVQLTQNLLMRFSSVTLNHVKGHQDDHVNPATLPIEARLNVDCDTRAKQKMRQAVTPSERQPTTEGHGATLFIGKTEVTTKMNDQIQYAASAEPMFKFLCKRFEWTDQQPQEINWRAIGLMKRRLSHSQSIQISK